LMGASDEGVNVMPLKTVRVDGGVECPTVGPRATPGCAFCKKTHGLLGCRRVVTGDQQGHSQQGNPAPAGLAHGRLTNAASKAAITHTQPFVMPWCSHWRIVLFAYRAIVQRVTRRSQAEWNYRRRRCWYMTLAINVCGTVAWCYCTATCFDMATVVVTMYVGTVSLENTR
jgi:hypothetical protein